MAQLIYLAIASLDGYIEDEEGKFDWARPSEEIHPFVNDLARPVGTYLYGRRISGRASSAASNRTRCAT
jgi:hypothetical protein